MSFSEIQEFPGIEEFLIVLINGPINVQSLQLSGDNLSLPAREISEQRRQLLGGMCSHFLKIQNIENGHHSTNQVTDNRFRRAKKLNNPNGGGTLIQLSALKTAVAISKNYIRTLLFNLLDVVFIAVKSINFGLFLNENVACVPSVGK